MPYSSADFFDRNFFTSFCVPVGDIAADMLAVANGLSNLLMDFLDEQFADVATRKVHYLVVCVFTMMLLLPALGVLI